MRFSLCGGPWDITDIRKHLDTDRHRSGARGDGFTRRDDSFPSKYKGFKNTCNEIKYMYIIGTWRQPLTKEQT